MKKLALFLVLCLLVTSIVPAFATEAEELVGEGALVTEPEVTEPEVTEPEVTEPEVTEPEVTEPEVTEPEVTEPEVTEPEVTEPEVTEPEVTEPEVTEPEVTEPEVTEPEVTEPEVTEPEVTEPEVTEPEVTEPEVTEPEVTEPEVTEPEVTEPEVTEPEVTEPEVTEPEVTEPEVTEPEEDLNQGAEADFVAREINGKWTVFQYNGSAASVTLPSTIAGKTVEVLSDACFANNVSLLNVTLPANIEVAPGAFRNCTSLLSCSMSNIVPAISDQCFEGCTSLQSIAWPVNLYYIGSRAFYGCVSLTGVPQQDSIYYIGDDAFYGCTSLAYADLSLTLDEIGQRAFEGCTALREIIIPNSVRFVGNEAFKNCSAATKLVLSSNTDFTIINNYTFQGCKSLQEIAIPANVIQIGREAFYDCSGCGIFRLHGNITTIGDMAFYGRSASSIIRWDDCKGTDVVYIGKDALGTSGYLLAPVGSAAHVYAKSHSGIKFITTLVRDFVLRCYNIILARNPGAPLSPANVEESGLLYWCKGVVDGSQSGASLVREFFESDEFKNQKNSNTVKVQRLYDAMLDRNGAYTAAEIKFWQDYLDVGMTTDYIINGFSTSNEFKALCVTYGMKPGSVTLSRYRDRNYLVTAFVSRLYTRVLDRAYDETGLEYWTKRLITKASNVAQVAEGFFFSNEFKAKFGNDNTIFLTKCYRAYFDREPDPVGWDYWMIRIVQGMKREKVLEGFASSAEWKNLCAKYGFK